MTFRVEVTSQAQRDADAIYDWLILQNTGEAGLRWFSDLESAIHSLRDFPERCPIVPELSNFAFEVRQHLYGNRPHVYRILFTLQEHTVYVLHIRHARRQPIRQ